MILLPPGLLDTARRDTWAEPVPLDRLVEHILDWLNDPGNYRQAAPLLTRFTESATGSPSPHAR